MLETAGERVKRQLCDGRQITAGSVPLPSLA